MTWLAVFLYFLVAFVFTSILVKQDDGSGPEPIEFFVLGIMWPFCVVYCILFGIGFLWYQLAKKVVGR